MTGQRLRRAAGVVAVAYIAVQGFQEYVYRVLPEPGTPAEELLLGAHPLHLARSTAMLLAMFALVFLYGVICLQRVRTRPVLAGAAFLSYFMFGLLEIGLRSTELFWTQIRLPAAYLAGHDPAILDQAATFQAVQSALYFPLQLSTLIGAIAMFFLFDAPPRINHVLGAAIALNVLRIATRMLTLYAGIPVFPTGAYENVYFVLVLLYYVPVAYWLFRLADDIADM